MVAGLVMVMSLCARGPAPHVREGERHRVGAIGDVGVCRVRRRAGRGPSPKFHRKVNVSPSGSDDATPERLHARAVQEGVSITGIGATFVGGSVNETTRVVFAASPHPSVRVNVTV